MIPLYLSRVVIRVSEPPRVERGVSKAYLIHQSIADLFGDEPSRPYLWRELAATNNVSQVVVLSRKPALVERASLVPPHRQVTLSASKPFRAELRAGQRLDFELRLNATQVVTSIESETESGQPHTRKQRRDIWDIAFVNGADRSTAMVDVYRAWLARQFDGAGTIGSLAVTERRLLPVRRSYRSAPMPIVATNLVGDLTVSDPEVLYAILHHGVGRARAFGCGLLCLAAYGSRPRRVKPAEEP